jgi:hypothetical protein
MCFVSPTTDITYHRWNLVVAVLFLWTNLKIHSIPIIQNQHNSIKDLQAVDPLIEMLGIPLILRINNESNLFIENSRYIRRC